MPYNPTKSGRQQARSHLDYLVKSQGFRCYWCDEKIIRVKNVVRSGAKVIATQRALGRVAYRSWTGTVYYARIATIDHVRPLSDGGSNNRFNLVAACYECNQTRNRVCVHGAGYVQEFSGPGPELEA